MWDLKVKLLEAEIGMLVMRRWEVVTLQGKAASSHGNGKNSDPDFNRIEVKMPQ